MTARSKPQVEESLWARTIRIQGKDRADQLLAGVKLGKYVPGLPAAFANASALQFKDFIWPLHRRPSQTIPTKAHRILLMRCGRGYGKNRMSSETCCDVAEQAGLLIKAGKLRKEEARILLVGRSAEDVRDAMVNGVSGIIARSRPWNKAVYQPGRRRVLWANGVEALMFSAAEPSQLRGNNGIFAWADEICSWGAGRDETWSNLELATRLGPFTPKILATTTPKPSVWLRQLIARKDVIDVQRPTTDNESNLSDDLVRQLYETHAGWIAQQELNGEIVDGDASYFPRENAQIIPSVPTDIVKVVRRWDLAATLPSPENPDPDWTAGVKMAKRENGRFVVLDVVLVRERPGVVEDLIRRTAERDGADVPILLPQDPGQAGKSQVEHLVRMLAGYVVETERETGPKETRAQAFASQWQHNNVELVRGQWNEPYLAQMESFPASWAHDDAVDSSAGAMNYIANAGGRSMFDVPLESWGEGGLTALAGAFGSTAEQRRVNFLVAEMVERAGWKPGQ